MYCGIPQQPCVCTVGSRNNHVCVLWDPSTTMCVYYGIPQQPRVCTVGSLNNHVCVVWDPAATTCVYYGIPQQPRVCTMGSRSNHTQSRKRAHDTQPLFFPDKLLSASIGLGTKEAWELLSVNVFAIRFSER